MGGRETKIDEEKNKTNRYQSSRSSTSVDKFIDLLQSHNLLFKIIASAKYSIDKAKRHVNSKSEVDNGKVKNIPAARSVQNEASISLVFEEKIIPFINKRLQELGRSVNVEEVGQNEIPLENTPRKKDDFGQ